MGPAPAHALAASPMPPHAARALATFSAVTVFELNNARYSTRPYNKEVVGGV
jgi:hypothetical protein